MPALSRTKGLPPSQPEARPVAVSAYLDGTAKMIEPPVMRGYRKFCRADLSPKIDVAVAGKRRQVSTDRRIGLSCLAGAAGAVGLGAALESTVGGGVGLLVGLAALPAGVFAARHLQASLVVPDFHADKPSSEEVHCRRLARTMEQQRVDHREDFQVAYLSGHGSHKQIAGFHTENLGRVIRQHPVDLTVFDACNTGQIEVLASLGPEAGKVLCSVHPVPGKGFPIEELLQPHVNQGHHAFEAAKGSTDSLNLYDAEAATRKLLPALDRLGAGLEEMVKAGRRADLKKLLAQSRGPEIFGRRVDMGSFLSLLEKERLPDPVRQATIEARAALKETVLESTGWTISFRLDGQQSTSLPPAWNRFVQALHLNWKPLL